MGSSISKCGKKAAEFSSRHWTSAGSLRHRTNAAKQKTVQLLAVTNFSEQRSKQSGTTNNKDPRAHNTQAILLALENIFVCEGKSRHVLVFANVSPVKP